MIRLGVLDANAKFPVLVVVSSVRRVLVVLVPCGLLFESNE